MHKNENIENPDNSEDMDQTGIFHNNGEFLEYKYKKPIPFNDVIANELIRMRVDLIDIKVNQNTEKWCSFPDEFVREFILYDSYKNDAVCLEYETPNKKKGAIIIFLNGEPLQNFTRRSIDFVDNAESVLRKLNSEKKYQIKTGMLLDVHIHDQEFPDALFSRRRAKIISIAEHCHSHSLVIMSIVLEIQECPKCEQFTRKIITFDSNHIKHFVIDCANYQKFCELTWA